MYGIPKISYCTLWIQGSSVKSRKEILSAELPTQGSSQNATFLPSPTLKLANSSTFCQHLEMLIHGLLRLQLTTPLVCQPNKLLPWMLRTTWLQREFSSFMTRQPHLAKSALFFTNKPPIPRPPSSYLLEVKSHLTK